MRKFIMFLCSLVFCHSAAFGQSAAKTAKLDIIVANQQSASASLLASDGSKERHLPVGTGPHEAAISADGKIAVVTIYGAKTPGNQLAVIDLARGSVIQTVELGTYTRPHGVVFLSDSPKRVAITSEASNSVVIVNLDGGQIEAAIPTQARGSHMLAVTADKQRGYTANIGGNSVSELDLATQSFVRVFDVPPRPEGIAVTPDGREVWVGSNETGAVTIISTGTGSITHTITGAVFPYRLAASPNGKFIAIVDAEGNKVHFADVAEHRITRAVDLEAPRGVAIGPDSKTAYVTLAGGSVSIIDVATGTVQQMLAVQASPDGIAVGARKVSPSSPPSL